MKIAATVVVSFMSPMWRNLLLKQPDVVFPEQKVIDKIDRAAGCLNQVNGILQAFPTNWL